MERSSRFKDLEQENAKALQHIEELKTSQEEISRRVHLGVSRVAEMKERKAALMKDMDEM